MDLGELIKSEKPQIVRRWLERVQRDVVEGGTPVEPTQLRDGLPDYLTALAELLASDREPDFKTAIEPAWVKVAEEHGITRVRIGFDITQLIHEFVVLRHVIREVADEHGLAADDPVHGLADALDAAVAASVAAYVDARDYEARKREAEHIGFLTHELRNPLSVLALDAFHLRARAKPDQLRYLDSLERGIHRMVALVDGVLTSERLEAGKAECHPVDVRLKDVVEPALEAARHVAASKGVAFDVELDGDLSLRIDPTLTQSAVQNLADNASKYTDAGAVRVKVESLPETIAIHVTDTGPGISAEDLRTIFEPFERGSTQKAGSGLGLAIARRAIEAQGGSLHAESKGPSGSHFWITLPREVSAEPSRAEAVAERHEPDA